MHQEGPPVWIFLLIPLVFPLFWCAICLLLSFVGGWQRLATSYASDRDPSGTAFTWQSGSVGLVNYRNVLHLHVAGDGLFLAVPPIFRVGHKPLFIPWHAMTDIEPRQILWVKRMRFRVGHPPIATVQVPAQVFEAKRA